MKRFKCIFVVVLSFLLLSCDNINEPENLGFDNSFLFIEYVTKTDITRLYKNNAAVTGYKFNENARKLKIDTTITWSLNDSNKFIFGTCDTFINSYYINHADTTKSSLICFQEHSFNFEHTFHVNGSPLFVTIKGIDCSPQGEMRVLHNDKEIILKPNEEFGYTLDYDISLHYTTIITIKNHGFIKKENVSYY